MFEKRNHLPRAAAKALPSPASGCTRTREYLLPEKWFSLEGIKNLLRTFRNISSLYLETGGVHSAALSTGKTSCSFPRISADTMP